jgi:periplasmic protein TonB
MTLRATRDDRISALEPSAAQGKRWGWALCSLLFHGTALAAVLIAVSGDGPQLPPPAIEVSVVAAPAPTGAAPRAAETPADALEAEPAEEPAEPQAEPLREIAEVEERSTPAAPPAEVQPLPTAELAPLPERAPPPPARKPEPPQQSPAPSQTTPVDAAPEPAPPGSAPATQLAALPTGEMVDSAAAPGAGASEPPRYEAGGEANPWPRYPAAARRRGIEGEVLVRVAVALDGRAERVEVVRSSGSALLDTAAVEALQRWRFEPARAGGQPVTATVEIPVTFRLTDPGS